ncbi:NAD(P)/FAD-dependent oxidoreductase [Sphingomicrobium sediminis]|uniref:FAD-dependent oxidoreductase n=1 Tax=Sphingomicrobium sediminis TaxID=2950949 RepID=A0A9X2EM22_9SPHN|nr:FAD-dependent oxidoreductase [Sphingomicrobium sediminis]MCM8557864.1 FAD-dependent oxidoreductase [Sphingomicrobium sediminis]
MNIAIIGAGMAGLSCAHALMRAGHDVRLFDKGRGPGGRMSTRRTVQDGETLRFDHGAQYFTVRDPKFAATVAEWEEAGIAARWPVAGEDAFVGTPAMNAPVKTLAEAADVQFATRIDTANTSDGSWILSDMEQPFDALIIAVPAEQAAEVAAPLHADFAKIAVETVSDPCWTVMASFADRLPHADILREQGAIGWAARDSAKPGRAPGERWVIQATPRWSRDHIEASPEDIAPELLSHFAAAIGVPLPDPTFLTAHRWRFARSGNSGDRFLWDEEIKLGLCGDWLAGPRVEAAWLSGLALAEAIG